MGGAGWSPLSCQDIFYFHGSYGKLYESVNVEHWADAWQNQQNDLCMQQRLRSACTATQSDQSSMSAM